MIIEGIVWCDGCGVEITWAPVVVGNAHYCCQDCRDGLECDCLSPLELEDERQPEEALPSGYDD
jgi:hypothetical protein